MNNYNISEARYKQLKQWMRDYPMWQNELGLTYTPVIPSSAEIQSTGISDPTGERAIILERYRTNCNMVESALVIAKIPLSDQNMVIFNVVNNTSYDDLVDRFGLRTTEIEFKAEVRRFLYYLDRVLAGYALNYIERALSEYTT